MVSIENRRNSGRTSVFKQANFITCTDGKFFLWLHKLNAMFVATAAVLPQLLFPRCIHIAEITVAGWIREKSYATLLETLLGHEAQIKCRNKRTAES